MQGGRDRTIYKKLPTRKFEYWCGNMEPFAQLAKPYGLVIEVKHL